MREQVILTGMVIKSAPAGEYDRRLVILTCERGKITAFARGARRPGSTLMAASAPFVFGTFALYEGRTLKLLYQSLRALLKSAIPNRLVRAVFELKLMEINGEYMEKPLGRLEDSTIYTWEYVLASPVEKLYTFTVTEKVLEEFTKCVAENKRRFVDKTFHSLDILDVLVYK